MIGYGDGGVVWKLVCIECVKDVGGGGVSIVGLKVFFVIWIVVVLG